MTKTATGIQRHTQKNSQQYNAVSLMSIKRMAWLLNKDDGTRQATI